MGTPHINANKGDFAKTVLMPGDPLRAKYVAENFLQDIVLVNQVRGILGYTGYYNGEKVSVMASGMGTPSMGIYSYELFTFFDVENIIRIGTAGAIDKDLHLRDVVLAMGACTNSNFANQYNLNGTFSPIASFKLLGTANEVANSLNLNVKIGNVLSSDNFYDDSNSSLSWNKLGVLAVEMETAGLYMNAARCKKNALTICTISDSLVTNEVTTSDERQTSFNDMVKIALETAIRQ